MECSRSSNSQGECPFTCPLKKGDLVMLLSGGGTWDDYVGKVGTVLGEIKPDQIFKCPRINTNVHLSSQGYEVSYEGINLCGLRSFWMKIIPDDSGEDLFSTQKTKDDLRESLKVLKIYENNEQI